MIHLFYTYREHGVVETRCDHRRRLIQRGRGTRAGVLYVDDRDPTYPHAAQHDLTPNAFLPGDQTRCRVPDIGCLKLRFVDSRTGDGLGDGGTPQGLQSQIHMLAEMRHTDAGNVCIHLHRTILYVTSAHRRPGAFNSNAF